MLPDMEFRVMESKENQEGMGRVFDHGKVKDQESATLSEQHEQQVSSARSFDPAHFAKLYELEEKSFWFRGRSDLIGWALDYYFPKVRNFLEVGCGTGYVLNRLQAERPGLDLSGSELFAEGLNYARQRLPQSVHLYQLDATNMPFREAFDAIGTFDVLEHIEDDQSVLTNINRALKPGGGLLITVPQHRWLWSGRDVAACHVRRYRKDELFDRLRKAGFEILRATSFVSMLLPALFLSRMRHRSSVSEEVIEGELNLSEPINRLGYATLRTEAAFIRAGVSFPAGGSLLVAARKPVN